jgi:hypothetical protein
MRTSRQAVVVAHADQGLVDGIDDDLPTARRE